MKIYKSTNVFDEALKRIRFVFDEFENIVINISGGKDSTVIFNLAMIVAQERGRLPLRVMWLDQEAEWQATADTVREIMYRPDVFPLWYQIPFRLFNATSIEEHWLNCWDPKEEARWMRPKDPISIKENVYGKDRFHDMFEAFMVHDFPASPACRLAGVRAEESPSRAFGLTSYLTYKWATWGKVEDKKRGHYTFYPIYDWSYTDVWKAIYCNKWPYNRIYDLMYQYGVPVHNMRVSNVHHETAVHDLFRLQEIEPATYERLTQRIAGIDMAAHMGKDNYFQRTLPFMFSSWKEYRDYLLEHLFTNPEWRAGFRKKIDAQERSYRGEYGDKLYRMQIQSILTNDWEGIKLKNFDDTPGRSLLRIELRERENVADGT